MEGEEELDRIVTGVVREWLFRKGLNDVLARFDEETDARSSSLSNTTALVSTLGLNTLYKRNLDQGRPLPSVLEVLTSHFVSNASSNVDCLMVPSPTADVGGAGAGASAAPAASAQGTEGVQEPATHSPVIAVTVAKRSAFWERLQQPATAPTVEDRPAAGTLLGGDVSTGQTDPSPAPLQAHGHEDVPMLHPSSTNAPPVHGTAPAVDGTATVDMDVEEASQAAEQESGQSTGVLPSFEPAGTALLPTAAPTPIPTPMPVPIAAPSPSALPPAPPSAPTAPAGAPAQAPAKKLGFFERMAAAQADKAKAAAPAASTESPAVAPCAPLPPPATVAAATVAAQEQLAAPQAHSLVPAAPPVVAAPPAPSLGGKFAARLAAQQAAPSPAPAPSAAPSPAPAAPSADSATHAPSEPAAKGKGSFWDRMNASKGSAAAPGQASAPVAAPTFTAPDGRTFTDKNEYRRYVFTTFYTFAGQQDAQLVKGPGQITGQPFNLENLRDCTVILADHSDTVQVDVLHNCRVLIAASCESVFLRNCTGCTFTIACKQLRTRDCRDCTVYLYSKTEPVIEASAAMRFAPYNAAYAGLDAHMKAAALEPERNYWDRIFDFSKDYDTAALPLPHWTRLPEGQWEEWRIEDLPGSLPGPIVNPVPRVSSLSSSEQGGDSGGMLSFDIRAGMQVAQAALEAQEDASATGAGGSMEEEEAAV